MLKAVIFDLGGTLLHYESAEADVIELNRRGFAAVYRHLSANGQMTLPEATFLTVVNARVMAQWQKAMASSQGGSIETSLRAALSDLGLSLTEAEWQSARQTFYSPIHQAAEPRQGARQTLQALKDQGVALGLLCNTFWAADVHDADLEHFGLLDFLPTRLYSCDIGWLKPHPEAFRIALTALGVRSEEAVYVGDRLKADAVPARRAGLWGVLIKVPFRDEVSEEIMPDAIITELPELIKLLEHRL
jgi:putative hydrolase of the HAD superfamily